VLTSAAMSTKDAGLRIRVEKELREAFVQACRAQDRAASDVLRDFMRTFTERQQRGQGDLFEARKNKSN
jgi:hypothetical protein